jgi:hypothetical protein
MVSPHQPLHAWRVVGAPSGVAPSDHIVDAALARDHATLTYGERCFELTHTVGAGSARFLRLTEVGRLSATGSGRSVLVFVDDGYQAEQRIAPCQDAWDSAVLRDLDARALSALGRALLDEAARVIDDEEGILR